MNNYIFDNIYFQSHARFATDNAGKMCTSQFVVFVLYPPKKTVLLFNKNSLHTHSVNPFNHSTGSIIPAETENISVVMPHNARAII